MTTPWWDDLSDSELEARLLQRGMDPDFAEAYVRNREMYQRYIDKALGEDI